MGGVHLRHRFTSQYVTPLYLSTPGYRTGIPKHCLVAWGLLLPLVLCIQCKPVCICAPSHTPPVLVSSSPLCPCPSVSELCIMLFDLFRLIIHVLWTPPAEHCPVRNLPVVFSLFFFFPLCSCSRQLLPHSAAVLSASLFRCNLGSKDGFYHRDVFSLTPALERQLRWWCKSACGQTNHLSHQPIWRPWVALFSWS